MLVSYVCVVWGFPICVSDVFFLDGVHMLCSYVVSYVVSYVCFICGFPMRVIWCSPMLLYMLLSYVVFLCGFPMLFSYVSSYVVLFCVVVLCFSMLFSDGVFL